MNNKPGLIPAHGGYRKLRSFQTAQIIYDTTIIFCERFIDKCSRTYDQMVQAARSGVQNIAEGSMASATSNKIELKLTGIARASQEELLLDYEDYLRQNGLKQWDKNSPESLAVRGRYKTVSSDASDISYTSGMSNKSDLSDTNDPYNIRTASAEMAANTLICLINQATYLLRKQIEKLGSSFLEEGGFTERLYRERKKRRDC
jgi:four helix bundle suffix protein